MLIPFRETCFTRSVLKLTDLPADTGAEVAFVGRSNAGKSSALNAITGVKNLARISKTPGRTQAINLFQITADKRLADLPGYGYAKVPLAIKNQWEIVLGGYLESRRSLRGLCIIMDIRHPLLASDQLLIRWANSASLPVHLLLSKADKLSRGAALQTLQKIQKQATVQGTLFSCQLFSAVSGEGIPEARKQVSQWLNSRLVEEAV